MKLSLLEAVNIKSLIGKKRNELEYRRREVLTVQVVDKTANYEKHTESVDELTSRIHLLIEQEAEISDLLSRANIANEITFEILGKSRTVTLANALSLVKVYRSELHNLQQFARVQKERLVTNSGVETYMIAQYEPSKYKELTDTLERNINALSLAINAKNAQIIVEVPFADEFL